MNVFFEATLTLLKNQIFIQALGIIGLLIQVFSIQNKKYSRVMVITSTILAIIRLDRKPKGISTKKQKEQAETPNTVE